MPPVSFRELEEHWCQTMKAACAVYLQAAEQHTRMIKDIAQGLVAPADGCFALSQARLSESLAFDQLVHATRVFADLVVTGQIPPPQEDDEELLI